MLDFFVTALLLIPSNTSVVADSQIDGYRVSGQMFLDQTFTGSQTTKRVAATCKNCRWLVSNYCKRENPFQQIASCDLPILGCENDFGKGINMRIWRQLAPNEDWTDVGIVCLGPKGPITPKLITESIKEEAVVFLPKLNPTSNPSQQALVKLPVYFASNQPRKFGPIKVSVAGFSVTLTAYPTWTWNFGDQQIVTRDPGDGWTVFHTWNKSGSYRVLVSTSWQADWQIEEFADAPLQVAEKLEQTSSLPLQLRPGWGQLTR